MAKLIYVANVSRDGDSRTRTAASNRPRPTDEVFTFITDLVRPIGTYLDGRRMYEKMAVWETQPDLAARSELMADFANVSQAADKIVHSTTLQAVSTATVVRRSVPMIRRPSEPEASQAPRLNPQHHGR